METYMIILIIIFILVWMTYWKYVHPRFKFKDKKFMKNKELLKIEYGRLNEQTYHLEIIGFSFIIAGLTIIEKGSLALFVLGLGFFVLTIIALPSYGRSERRYRCFRGLIKK